MTTTYPQTKATVWLAPVSDYDNVYHMVWTANPTTDDVRAVFVDIYAVQKAATAPVHFIVDLTENPNFPMGMTMSGAIKAHNHTNMGYWLVVGSNRVARLIGGFLMNFKQSIEWFNSEDEAMAYLEKLLPKDRA